ncbi:cyclase family protein [Desulfoscipio gibsoniae]|uniref:Kynurenine formamidase n=1 Tax=Desulfoscipio gibsoniae DSM 7213 TaxID=767817 RepID=R4KKM3_9FIRM|nr:cyclase family protein [Desulfoscipio gibsoniae]AGL01055.1 putative metal-dependent hydrolase [Desulfoscipio gibsoniae DSM 7213]
MKIYDISMIVHPDMPVYKNKNDKRPVLSRVSDFTNGSTYESRIQMNIHTGTHVDAPLHMLPGGATIDQIDLRRLITPCKVFDLTALNEKISASDLAKHDIKSGDFILLRTRNSYIETFDFNFTYLDSSGAAYLKDKSITGVGIDALGIERDQPGHETHKILFEAGIVILEGLRLKDVVKGKYLLIAAPLKIRGAEGAPVRAVLVQEEARGRFPCFLARC